MSSGTFVTRVRKSLRGCRLRPSLRLCLFEEEYAVDVFGLLIALPFMDRFRRNPCDMMESWGVYYMERSVVWCWGSRTKFWHMPWELSHIKTEVFRPDGTWAKRVQCYETGSPDGRAVWTLPYRYELQSGEVQNRTATVYVERMEWRQRWLRWCPLFTKKRQSIEVMFDGEVGEQSGSWKGGVIGTGYTMKRGETAEMTLRRMEVEYRV